MTLNDDTAHTTAELSWFETDFACVCVCVCMSVNAACAKVVNEAKVDLKMRLQLCKQILNITKRNDELKINFPGK